MIYLWCIYDISMMIYPEKWKNAAKCNITGKSWAKIVWNPFGWCGDSLAQMGMQYCWLMVKHGLILAVTSRSDTSNHSKWKSPHKPTIDRGWHCVVSCSNMFVGSFNLVAVGSDYSNMPETTAILVKSGRFLYLGGFQATMENLQSYIILILDESNECSLLCVTSELHCASKSWVPLFWSIFHLLGWTLAQNSFLKHPPSVWTSNDGHGIENLWGWGTDTLDSTICDLKLFPNCKLWANFAKNGQRTHFLSALPPPHHIKSKRATWFQVWSNFLSFLKVGKAVRGLFYVLCANVAARPDSNSHATKTAECFRLPKLVSKLRGQGWKPGRVPSSSRDYAKRPIDSRWYQAYQVQDLPLLSKSTLS